MTDREVGGAGASWTVAYGGLFQTTEWEVGGAGLTLTVDREKGRESTTAFWTTDREAGGTGISWMMDRKELEGRLFLDERSGGQRDGNFLDDGSGGSLGPGAYGGLFGRRIGRPEELDFLR